MSRNIPLDAPSRTNEFLNDLQCHKSVRAFYKSNCSEDEHLDKFQINRACSHNLCLARGDVAAH